MKIFFVWCLFFMGQVYGSEPTIAIITALAEGAKPWDPDSIRSGITGSEEAVIYVSGALAKLGYKVLVFGEPPEGSPHSLVGANPRFLSLRSNSIPKVEIAIAWRMPKIGALLKQCANRVYFWPHDLCEGSFLEAEVRSFDGVLWLSSWQRQHWISANPGWAKFTRIFGNGVLFEQFKAVEARENPYSCIYASNYARGLDLLLDLWPRVKKRFPRATLDIYYGWQHWGLLSAEKEKKIRTQLAHLSALDVKEHGLVGHEELTRAYEKASFWTYPCTMPETFCITALRAQLAGAVPVVLLGSALHETVRHGYRCNEREAYLATWMQAMEKAETITLEERQKMGQFIKKDFTWDQVAQKWSEQFLRDLQ
jgi:glycosyltransferase involved in cell wall biosynthesis